MLYRDKTKVSDQALAEYFDIASLKKYMNKRLFDSYKKELTGADALSLEDYVVPAVDQIFSILGANAYQLEAEFLKTKQTDAQGNVTRDDRNKWLLQTVAIFVSYDLQKVLSFTTDMDSNAITESYNSRMELLMAIAKGKKSAPIPTQGERNQSNALIYLSAQEDYDISQP